MAANSIESGIKKHLKLFYQFNLTEPCWQLGIGIKFFAVIHYQLQIIGFHQIHRKDTINSFHPINYSFKNCRRFKMISYKRALNLWFIFLIWLSEWLYIPDY